MLCKMLTLGKMSEGILCMYFYNFFYKSKIIQTLKKNNAHSLSISLSLPTYPP